ncbi:MAG: type II secretion system minor pseudopilin GspK [Proteobacteria bacterium]|nr:type II secretion system minor pseudopilin GspK [Pseudomonadota bacterium]
MFNFSSGIFSPTILSASPKKPLSDGSEREAHPRPRAGVCSGPHPLALAREQAGLALVTVVLIVSLLAVVLVEFAYNSRIQLRMADSFAKQLKAYTIARGGIDAAADLLLFDSRKGQVDFFSAPLESFDFSGGSLPDPTKIEEIWSWAAQGTPFSYPVGDGILAIKISDENGKINLNQVEEVKTRKIAYQLFETIISTSAERGGKVPAEALVDSIREWTDGDLETGTDSQGAEADFYLGLTPSYSSKEGALDSLSELRLIGGFTPQLYAALMEGAGPEARKIDALGSPLVTVFPQQSSGGKININTAPALVLESLHESFTPGWAQEIIDYRKDKPFRSITDFLSQFVPDSQTRLDLQNLIAVKSDVFSISSTGVVGDLAITIKTVITRIPSENRVGLLYFRVEG